MIHDMYVNSKRQHLSSSLWEIQLVFEHDLGRKEWSCLGVFREKYLSWVLMDLQPFNWHRRVQTAFPEEARPQASPSTEMGKRGEGQWHRAEGGSVGSVLVAGTAVSGAIWVYPLHNGKRLKVARRVVGPQWGFSRWMLSPSKMDEKKRNTKELKLM